MRVSAIWTYAISTGSMLISVAAQSFAFLIVARYLGKVNYGHLATLTALTSICAPWVQLGTAELVRRRVAVDVKQYPRILGHCIIVLFGLGSIATVIVSIALTFFVHFGKGVIDDFVTIWLFSFCGLVLYPWMVLVEQIFLAHDMLSRANVTSAGFGAWRAVMAAVACAGFGARAISEWAAWNFGAYAVASIAGAFAIVRFGAPVFQIIKGELATGATFGVSGFLYNLRGNVDILSLSLFSTPELVGSLGLARKLVSVTYVTSASLDRLIYARLVKASQMGLRSTASAAIRFAIYGVIITGLTASALFVTSPYLISYLFGSQYSDAILLVRFLCGLVVLVALQNVAFDALNSANLHRIQITISFACVVVGAISVVFLTYIFRLYGAISGLYIMETSLAIALWTGLQSLAHPKAFKRLVFILSRSQLVPRS